MIDRLNDNILFNGNILNIKEINFSLKLDGYNIYDVLRIIDGVPLFYEEHYNRLVNSSKLLNVDIPVSNIELYKQITTLTDFCNNCFGNIKTLISFNKEMNRWNIILYFIKTRYPSTEDYNLGVYTVTLAAERTNPNIKLINTNLRQLSNSIIEEKHVYEVILIDEEGNITEGSRTNIFFIKGETIYTPPTEDVLPGITRLKVINICISLNIKYLERKIHLSEINEMDAVFITGTSPLILPVKKLDDINFSNKNKIAEMIINKHNEIISDYIKARKLPQK